jgi:hypothetical protein
MNRFIEHSKHSLDRLDRQPIHPASQITNPSLILYPEIVAGACPTKIFGETPRVLQVTSGGELLCCACASPLPEGAANQTNPILTVMPSKNKIVCLSNVFDQHYHDLRGEKIDRCLGAKRPVLFRCLEMASDREVIVLSAPPKAMERRGLEMAAAGGN